MTARIRTASVLAALATATLAASTPATAAPLETADVRVSADVRGWPPELTENTRLFVTPYRSYLVQIVRGEPTLVLSTGFDSCYFMTQHGQQRYPC